MGQAQARGSAALGPGGEPGSPGLCPCSGVEILFLIRVENNWVREENTISFLIFWSLFDTSDFQTLLIWLQTLLFFFWLLEGKSYLKEFINVIPKVPITQRYQTNKDISVTFQGSGPAFSYSQATGSWEVHGCARVTDWTAASLALSFPHAHKQTSCWNSWVAPSDLSITVPLVYHSAHGKHMRPDCP